MRSLEYAFLGVGVALLAISLVLAYEIYVLVSSAPTPQIAVPTGNVNQTIVQGFQAMIKTVRDYGTALLEMVALFLLAYVGYKFAMLGLAVKRVKQRKARKARAARR